jgi:hypothetical protein
MDKAEAQDIRHDFYASLLSAKQAILEGLDPSELTEDERTEMRAKLTEILTWLES